MAQKNSALGYSQPHDADSRHGIASMATRRGVRRQRRVWSRRVSSWDQHGSAGLGTVTAAVLTAADVRPGDQVVDLGCGQGQISLPLARQGAEVFAVDVSPAMVAQLTTLARRDGMHSLAAAAIPIEELAAACGQR